jgi:hypothetical protein
VSKHSLLRAAIIISMFPTLLKNIGSAKLIAEPVFKKM